MGDANCCRTDFRHETAHHNSIFNQAIHLPFRNPDDRFLMQQNLFSRAICTIFVPWIHLLKSSGLTRLYYLYMYVCGPPRIKGFFIFDNFTEFAFEALFNSLFIHSIGWLIQH